MGLALTSAWATGTCAGGARAAVSGSSANGLQRPGANVAAVAAGAALTLEQALARALAYSTTLRAAQQAEQATRGTASSTALVAAPTLKLSADQDTGVASNKNPALLRSKLELSWSPPRIGETPLRAQQLARQVAQAQLNTDTVRQRVAGDVRQLHAALTALQAMRAWSEQGLQLQQQLVSVAQRQLALGRRTRQSLIELRQQALAAEAAHEDVLAEHSLHRSRLLALMGQPDDPTLTVPPRTGPYLVENQDTELLAQQATVLETHPELLAQQARCATLNDETQLKALDNGRWLKSVATTYKPRSGDRAANVELTLELTLPAPGHLHGDAAALHAQRQACQAAVDDLRANLRERLRQAAVDSSRSARAARLQLRQLAALQEAASLVQAARDEARVDESELLAARLAVAQGQMATLRRLLEAEAAQQALLTASGHQLL